MNAIIVTNTSAKEIAALVLAVQERQVGICREDTLPKKENAKVLKNVCYETIPGVYVAKNV